MNNKKWTKHSLILLFLLIFLIGLFNFIVDPYSVFNNSMFKKYEYKDRISSSIKLERNSFDSIIIGSSRTQIGIDTKNKLFNGNTINVSMSGTNVFEIHKVFNKIYNTQQNNIDIFYGLDFLTFNDKRLPGEQFQQSLYDINSSELKLYISLLFSIDSIKSSIRTIKKNLLNKNNYNLDGFKEKKEYSYKEQFDKILINNFLVNDGTYGCYNYGEDRLKMFEEIIKKSENKNLYLFITPLHHRHIIALKHLGLFDQYIHWIYDLYSIVRKYNLGNFNIKLYDFSYLNFVTSEKVSDNVKYYWESSHYKKIVGNMIVENILSSSDNFGVLLNNINISNYLNSYINDYYSFFQKESLTYINIYNLYINTEKERVDNCSKYTKIQTRLNKELNYNPISNLKKEKKKSLNLLLELL